jgi:hypothetical protein
VIIIGLILLTWSHEPAAYTSRLKVRRQTQKCWNIAVHDLHFPTIREKNMHTLLFLKQVSRTTKVAATHVKEEVAVSF